MTIGGEPDDRERSSAGGANDQACGPARTTCRDLERYAGLFAARTRLMKSSAMRDLMAITARPEVISLAGGLPDTSTFPPETFAARHARIARGVVREGASVRPDRGASTRRRGASSR